LQQYACNFSKKIFFRAALKHHYAVLSTQCLDACCTGVTPQVHNNQHGGFHMKSANELTIDDREVCLLVMDIIPELKIAALAVKRCRERGLSYPIESVDSIAKLYDGEQLVLDGHKINREMLNRYIYDTLPIMDDAQLARAVYLGLGRCNTDMAWALQAPPHARDLLDEMEKFTTKMTKGECDA
jgi:hypothetical protein